MNNNDFTNNEEINLVVEKLVYGGYGMARYEGKIYLIENSYPGDFLKVIPSKITKNLVFAKPVEIIAPSNYRIPSVCKHYPECGGCQWLDCKYEYQLEAKTNIVKEQLSRIGKIDESFVKNTIKSDIIWEYRNRMEYTFQNNQVLTLGLKEKHSNNVINIFSCPISPKEFDIIKNDIRNLVEKLNLSVYDKKNKTGILKHLVLRKTFYTNQLMAIIVTHTEYLPFEKEIKDYFNKNYHISSLIHVMNSSDKIILRGPYRTLLGEGVIEEEFDSFKFQIPPTSFFQNNYNVTKKILRYILDYFKKNAKRTDTLLDLYSGVGLFSVYYAPLFKFVESVESSKVSVKASISNTNINSIKNIKITQGIVKNFLANNKTKKYDFVIVDPPRNGLYKKEIEMISNITNKAVIYVSCDPSTLARDLSIFIKKGFNLISVQPFDMFPNTYHIENVVILEKKY
jgi:23S rRNA (uracil1939-C5)-methyltransferase